MKFDDLKYFASKKIVFAYLILYKIEGHKWHKGGQYGENSSMICKVTEPWDEETVTWNNQPSFQCNNAINIPQNNE